VADILADTGLTKGALYHHFPTKLVLGLAVMDEVIRAEFETSFILPLRGDGKNTPVILNTLKNWVEGADSGGIRLGCPLNNLLIEMSQLDGEFRERITAILGDFTASVEQALVRAKKSGEIKNSTDCRAVALFIVSSWLGAGGIAKAIGSKQPLLNCLGQLEIFISSLKSDDVARRPPVVIPARTNAAEEKKEDEEDLTPEKRPSVRMDED